MLVEPREREGRALVGILIGSLLVLPFWALVIVAIAR